MLQTTNHNHPDLTGLLKLTPPASSCGRIAESQCRTPRRRRRRRLGLNQAEHAPQPRPLEPQEFPRVPRDNPVF